MTSVKPPSRLLADLIASHSEHLLSNWRGSMRKLLVARNLSNPVLNDHMQQLLTVLVSELRTESAEALIDDNGSFAASEIPVTHGLDRLNLGFDLEEVVGEYNSLRNVILELAVSHQINTTGPVVHILNRVIDGSIGIAVKAFSAQQAREIRLRRDEYLAFAVHDLRSPLASLSLATSLLDRQIGATQAESKELLRIMRVAVHKLERLIQRVLKEDAAVRAQEEHRVEAAWVELSHMLQKLIEELQPLADHSKVELRLDCPPGLSAYVDEGWAELIFQNLISNAIRYSPGGLVTVGATGSDEGIQCSVTDNGCGIEPERLPRIFESGETDSPAGFGLGLSIVERLVKAHGGDLRVESKSNQGTRFLFGFPTPRPATQIDSMTEI